MKALSMAKTIPITKNCYCLFGLRKNPIYLAIYGFSSIFEFWEVCGLFSDNHEAKTDFCYRHCICHRKSFHLTPNKPIFRSFWKWPKLHSVTFDANPKIKKIALKSVLMDRFSKTKKFCVKKDEDYHIKQQKQLFGKKNCYKKNDNFLPLWPCSKNCPRLPSGQQVEICSPRCPKSYPIIKKTLTEMTRFSPKTASGH